MAQTGYTPILIYSSSTASNAPVAGNLTNSTLGSELAINITDGKLFYKDNSGSVQVIGWKTVPTTAGGTGNTSYTAGDINYYASGTAFTKLAIGSAYQALQVNAGATAPSWQPSATSVLTTQGDLLYASAANTLARLAKNTTASRYLSNSGTSNNPAWAQVDLTNGVTGTLPVANGGTGNTTGAATAVISNATTGLMQITGPSAATTRVMTIPDANFTAARTDAAQTFVNGQIFGTITSGKITSSATGSVFESTASTTGIAYGFLSNTGGNIFYGVDNSAGTAVFSNSLPYATVLGSSTNTSLVLAAAGFGRLTIFNTGGVSIGNSTDPGAGNLNVNGSTLKVGTTSLYNSSANIGTFSWSSASNVGGEGAYVFVNTSTSANSDPNPILAIHKGSTTTSSSARFVQFFANGAAQAMGGIVGNGATNVQFVSLSDEREKENIQPVTGALDRLMQIQVCSFDRKGGGDHVKAGFIAQNVLPVYPEYVVENAANADDDPRYGITGGMSAGYVAELTAAIQEQQAMINDLKQKLEQYIAKN